MGESVSDKRRREEEEKQVVPQFTEYKPPEKKAAPAPAPAAPKEEAPKQPMTKAEMKRQKKLDKINAEFEKQLKARGIDLNEGDRSRRR